MATVTTLSFDTLAFVKKLEAKGFEPQQAKGIAEALKDANLVTRPEITKTADYINAAREKIGLRRNTQLARLIGTYDSSLSYYENGKRVMDDYTAARLAELLEINPLKIIAQVKAEREKNAEKRAFWQRLARAACLVPILTIGTNFVPIEAEAAPIRAIQTHQVDNLEIMRNCGSYLQRFPTGLKSVSQCGQPPFASCQRWNSERNRLLRASSLGFAIIRM